MEWVVLFVSVIVWWFLYSFELAMNGAIYPLNASKYLWEEITWLRVFPGWKERILKAHGPCYDRNYDGTPYVRTKQDEDRIIEMYPNISHFIFFHCLFLLGPTLIYCLTR